MNFNERARKTLEVVRDFYGKKMTVSIPPEEVDKLVQDMVVYGSACERLTIDPKSEEVTSERVDPKEFLKDDVNIAEFFHKPDE